MWRVPNGLIRFDSGTGRKLKNNIMFVHKFTISKQAWELISGADKTHVYKTFYLSTNPFCEDAEWVENPQDAIYFDTYPQAEKGLQGLPNDVYSIEKKWVPSESVERIPKKIDIGLAGLGKRSFA